jgi:thiol-disulfide isomerase/thioredoxin
MIGLCALVAAGLASRIAGASDGDLLKVGDVAPKLQTGAWVQGEPVGNFEKGKVYLVEFWATWCRPCLANVPHLNELDQTFKDKGLVVIGQNVWEGSVANVPKVVQREKMSYRIALDDIKESQEGKMGTTWLKAAGIPGVPSAFLVDRQGRLAWIGYPGNLKPRVIEEVLADTYDLAKAAASYKTELANRPKVEKFCNALGSNQLAEAESLLREVEQSTPPECQSDLNFDRLLLSLRKKDFESVYELAKRVSEDWFTASDLNDLAWLMATTEDLDKKNLALAETIAIRASGATHDETPAYLVTLARLQFRNGKRQDAIDTQQKAVELTESKARPEREKMLTGYKEGKLPPAK